MRDRSLRLMLLSGFMCVLVSSIVVAAGQGTAGKPAAPASGAAAKPAAGQTAKPAAAAPAGAAATPLTDADSLSKGKAIFDSMTSMCFTCHKNDLGGLVGPNLTDGFWIHGCGFADIVKNIQTGFPDKGMQPFGSGTPLTPVQVRQVASYVVSKKGSNPPGAKPIDATREKACK